MTGTIPPRAARPRATIASSVALTGDSAQARPEVLSLADEVLARVAG